jgi:hypothetical protein
MAKKIRVWDGSAWQDVAPALPYTAVHSAQASMPSTAVDGQIWLDTDASVPSTSVTRWYKLPAAGTTTLFGNDDNSIPLAYTPGYEQVFLNGTLLSRSAADYTATTGTSVVLSSAIVAGDIVEIICPLQITTTDTYTQSAANNKFVQNTEYSAAGKNFVINGGFDIWQRSTSQAMGASGTTYTADRWATYSSPTSTTISRQLTNDTTNLPHIQYCARIQRTSGATETGALVFGNSFETINSIPLAGKTVTLSFYARAGANFSSSSNSLVAYLKTGTGTNQNLVSTGFTGNLDVIGQGAILNTTWQRFSYSTTLGSSITQVGIELRYSATGTAGASDYFEVTGVQLEIGSVATSFSRAGGNIQGELAACQRYYWRKSAANNLNSFFATGSAASTTSAFVLLQAPTTMRVPPTAIDFSGCALNDGANSINTTSLTLNQANENGCWINAVVSSGLTQFRPYVLWSGTNVNAFIGLSSEL